jgi:hypothetical protein
MDAAPAIARLGTATSTDAALSAATPESAMPAAAVRLEAEPRLAAPATELVEMPVPVRVAASARTAEPRMARDAAGATEAEPERIAEPATATRPVAVRVAPPARLAGAGQAGDARDRHRGREGR